MYNYSAKDEYLSNKKYILNITHHPAASHEGESLYYLCNVVQKQVLITLTLKHLTACQ